MLYFIICRYQIKSAYRKLHPSLSNTEKAPEELMNANANVHNQNTMPHPTPSNDDPYSHHNSEPASSSMILSPTDGEKIV